MKYRKKPVTIDAVLWDGKIATLAIIEEWAGIELPFANTAFSLSIPTLAGTMLSPVGDWIIRDAEGEIYPCKPDIFELTYEPVLEEKS